MIGSELSTWRGTDIRDEFSFGNEESFRDQNIRNRTESTETRSYATITDFNMIKAMDKQRY
jgi:hypothetical protein